MNLPERLLNILINFEESSLKTFDLKQIVMNRIWNKNTTMAVKNDIDVEVDFLSDHLSKLAAKMTMDLKIYELKLIES